MTQFADQKQTILVIDDEPHNLRLMLEYLESHQYRVLVSQDGASGLQRARYAKPDLILLDVVLPDIDGFELCRQLKADVETQMVPVIFLTMLMLPEDKVKAFQVGGADYLSKPVQWEEVLVRVTTQLQLAALRRQVQATDITVDANSVGRIRQLEEMNRTLTQRVLELSQLLSQIND